MTEGVLINKMTETGKSAGEMEEVTLIPKNQLTLNWKQT
ncbi:Formylmethanofuran dehydrogenase (molybdenum) subunit C [Methanosarcina siciliae T4/M]|uniref:Formylmethanofuran dehydrogenase (Molybdenum) subunit C n=1 Tax=Methanosarcina siciliae T4/M TaxID=1434120 RepID=A0A0E3L7L5_9EURY|nr:Formylmethanofuran dehydrogenase (molybdenum) subunit C [Methanosarcina siciliae T4/M]